MYCIRPAIPVIFACVTYGCAAPPQASPHFHGAPSSFNAVVISRQEIASQPVIRSTDDVTLGIAGAVGLMVARNVGATPSRYQYWVKRSSGEISSVSTQVKFEPGQCVKILGKSDAIETKYITFGDAAVTASIDCKVVIPR